MGRWITCPQCQTGFAAMAEEPRQPVLDDFTYQRRRRLSPIALAWVLTAGVFGLGAILLIFAASSSEDGKRVEKKTAQVQKPNRPIPSQESPISRPATVPAVPVAHVKPQETRPPQQAWPAATPPPAAEPLVKSAPAPAPLIGGPAIQTSDWNLGIEFDSNPVAAKQKYQGRPMDIEGIVGDVWEDSEGGGYLVQLARVDPGFRIAVVCRLNSQQEAANLRKGLACVIEGRLHSFATLSKGRRVVAVDNCKILEIGPDMSLAKQLEAMAAQAAQNPQKAQNLRKNPPPVRPYPVKP
jgi:hypothetical protein